MTIKGDMRLLKWMISANFAATLAVLAKVFFH